jgi:hypothetical protein
MRTPIPLSKEANGALNLSAHFHFIFEAQDMQVLGAGKSVFPAHFQAQITGK